MHFQRWFDNKWTISSRKSCEPIVVCSSVTRASDIAVLVKREIPFLPTLAHFQFRSFQLYRKGKPHIRERDTLVACNPSRSCIQLKSTCYTIAEVSMHQKSSGPLLGFSFPGPKVGWVRPPHNPSPLNWKSVGSTSPGMLCSCSLVLVF